MLQSGFAAPKISSFREVGLSLVGIKGGVPKLQGASWNQQPAADGGNYRIEAHSPELSSEAQVHNERSTLVVPWPRWTN